MSNSQAVYQAAFEDWCSSRIHLPFQGLEGALATFLKEQGFYWEQHGDYAKVLYPDGWSLIPSEELQTEEKAPFTGYLVNPEGVWIAEITYSGYDNSDHWAVIRAL